jgi:NDP-hexose-3-ketoreductase
VGLHGSATLRSPESGLTAQLAFGFSNLYTSEYELWGSEGSLLCDRAFAKPPTLAPHVRIARQGESTDYTLVPDDHFVRICEEFATCIRDGAFEKHWQEAYDQSRVLTELEHIARKTYI